MRDTCGICGRKLDQKDDPLSDDCGGDCWGCIGEIEAEMGDEYSLAKVRDEFAKGLRPGWDEPSFGGLSRAPTTECRVQKIMKDSEKFMSWLKYLDIEYLDEITFNTLSDFDINDPSDWSNIVEVAMRDEAISFNQVSRVSMIAVLDDLAGYPESEVRRLLERVTMPFDAPLRDYISFFQYVRRELFDGV